MEGQSDRGRFVERGDELVQIEDALAGASAGSPSLVVVAGEAGVGKTRLLTEFARASDCQVLWGTCLPIGEHGLPFAPIVEALRTWAVESGHGDEIPGALRVLLSDQDDGVEKALTRSQLFQSILGFLEDLANKATTILVLEDLHWSDPSTRDLLTYLVPNMRGQHLLVVGSYRTDDLRRDHPLRSVLAELSRHPQVRRLNLPPFTAGQIKQQLEYLTGQPPTDKTLSLVANRTQGNAYFVEELVAAEGLDGRDLPASLRELLLVRADVVSVPTRRLLRIASLAESSVSSSLLAEVSGVPIEDVREQLHEALDAELLTSTQSGVRFHHALLRETLQLDLLAGERAEYHAAYARALRHRVESNAEPAAATAELAYHLQHSADLPSALRAWLDAATAAEAAFAFAEAHVHLSRALNAWEVVDNPEHVAGLAHRELLVRAAEDAFLGGDATAACELVEIAIDSVDDRAEPLQAGVLYERLSRYLRDTDRHDEVYKTIERAVELVPESPPSVERARVLAGLAGRLSTLGRYQKARDVGAQALAMARLVGSSLVECDALNTLGSASCFLTDEATALVQIDSALELAKANGDSHQQMRSYWNSVVCCADSGNWEESVRLARLAIDVLPRLGLAHLVPELYSYAVQDLMMLGRWAEAQTLLDEAVARFPANRDEATPIEFVIAKGDFHEARRLISAASSRDIFLDREEQALVMVHLAELETWEGNTRDARGAVDNALSFVVDTDRPIAAAHGLTVAMRCEGDAATEAVVRRRPDNIEQARTRGAAHIAQMQELLTRPGPKYGWKREVSALFAICNGERTRVDGLPDPTVWAEATRATSEMCMGYHHAYTQFRQAEAILAADGDRTDASSLLMTTHQTADTLGARPLKNAIERFARRARIKLGIPSTDHGAFGLTDRERQVLDLVAQGATNRQIGEELFISEKTASVHVSNIIRKLGVTNRGEAGSAAYREGLVGS